MQPTQASHLSAAWPTVRGLSLIRAISIVCLSAVSVACGPSWSELRSTEGNFTVIVPDTPEEETHAVATALCSGSEREYLAADGPHPPLARWGRAIPSGYSVAYCTVSVGEHRGNPGEAETKERLYREMEVLLKRTGAVLLGSRHVDMGGVPALEYEARTARGDVSRSRLLTVGGIRYHLAAVGEDRREVHSTRANRFLDSFRVLEHSGR